MRRQIIETYKALLSAQESLIELQRDMLGRQERLILSLSRLLSASQAERDLTLQRSQLVLN